MLEDKKQLYGPLRVQSKDWEERLMAVPEGSERLRSVAAKEIDAKLQEWRLEKDEGDDAGKAQRSGRGE
jgi:hypothetical protein